MLAQVSIGQKMGELLLGLLGPSLLAVAWWWGLRCLVKPEMARRLYTQPPLDRLMPALLLVLCCFAASILWASRRWVSYGLLLPIAVAALIAVVLFWRKRPSEPMMEDMS